MNLTREQIIQAGYDIGTFKKSLGWKVLEQDIDAQRTNRVKANMDIPPAKLDALDAAIATAEYQALGKFEKYMDHIIQKGREAES